jgi:hypothetical protein
MQNKIFQKKLGQNKHKSVQVHEATKFRWASTTMTMIDQSSKYMYKVEILQHQPAKAKFTIWN